MPARRDHLLRQPAGLLRHAAAAAFEPGQHRFGRILQLAAPSGQILAGDRLGHEHRVLASAFGKRPVHLRRAQPELAGQREEEMIGIGQIGWAAGRGCARGGLIQRVVQVPKQIIEGQRPAVTLIAHEAEQHADRARLRTALARQLQLDRSEQRRRIGEARPLDQEATHLDLGMRSGLQPPIDLQHRVVFEQHRAVRLLGAETADDQPLGRRDAVEDGGPAEAHLPKRGAAGIAQRQGCLALDRVRQRQGEAVLSDRLDQRALAAGLAQLGEDCRGQPLPQFAAGRRPYCAQGQEIALSVAAGQLRLDDTVQEAGRVAVALLRRAGDLAIRQQPSRLHPPVLSAEPALARQEGGDHVAFELRQVMRPEEIGPAPRHDQRDALR